MNGVGNDKYTNENGRMRSINTYYTELEAAKFSKRVKIVPWYF